MKTKPTRLLRWLLLFLVYLTGGAGSRSAQAQPAAASVSCDEDEECARLADLGREHSQAGRFDAAEQAYESAYLRRPDAKLLYNLARVLHKAGRPAEAAGYYQKYLDAGAEGSEEQRRKTESYLQQARAAAPSPAPTVNSQPQLPPQKIPAQELIPKRPRWRLILGGATVGAGLLFLGFGTSALSAQGSCVGAPVAPAQTCGYVFTTDAVGGSLVGIGAALTLGGVTLMAWPPKRSLSGGT